jgi:Rieske Fe-S protein
MTKSKPPLCQPFILTALSLLLISLAACSSLQYTSQEPEIGADAYTIKGETVEVTLAEVPALSQVGGAATIVDDTLPSYLIIVQPEAGEFVVASSRCTHRGMALSYQHNTKEFQCSSGGGSKFKLDGSVTKGPAENRLRIYPVSIEDGILIIDISN